MGKRGPKPKGEYPDQSAVFSTRITPDLRASLIAAVEEKRRRGREASLAQEIEHRLRRSFIEDKTKDEIGGSALYGIFNLLVAAMRMAGEEAYVAKHGQQPTSTQWLRDAFAYDQAARSVTTILDALRPPGEPKSPALRRSRSSAREISAASPAALSRFAQVASEIYANVGASVASSFIRLLLDTPSALPLPSEKLSDEEKLTYRIADWLRPLIEHLRDPSDATPTKRHRKTKGGKR